MEAYRYLIALAVISLCVAVAERLAPRRKDQPFLRKSLAWDFVHLTFNGHFLGVILYGVGQRHLAPHLDAFLVQQGWKALLYQNAAGSWSFITQAVVALFIIDFMQWCVHNALHRVPFLWRTHQCHHSVVDGEMDWVVAFRFQWTEVVIYRLGLYIPMAWLGFGADALMVHAIFGTLIGHLNHANINIDYGPMRYLLNSPKMHLWHHDYEGTQRSTKNFGIIFSLWDWIFGTAYLPSHAPTRIGFPGDEEVPRNFLAAQAWPLGKLVTQRWREAVATALGVLLIGLGWYLH